MRWSLTSVVSHLLISHETFGYGTWKGDDPSLRYKILLKLSSHFKFASIKDNQFFFFSFFGLFPSSFFILGVRTGSRTTIFFLKLSILLNFLLRFC